MGVTATLSEFTAGLRIDALPADVVTRARFLVLDLVGNIVRARHDAESTQSFLGTGAFYEWPFGRLIGGHFAAGPSLEYDAMWSQAFGHEGLVASARLVFYGGP